MKDLKMFLLYPPSRKDARIENQDAMRGWAVKFLLYPPLKKMQESRIRMQDEDGL
jgi:hypothetical protein